MNIKHRASPVTPTGSEPVTDKCLAGFVGYQLKRAQHVLTTDLNATLRPLGLRMLSYSVLAMITDNSGVRPSQISDVLAIERSNLVVVLDQLEQSGLIRRDRVPTDRRAYALTPTAAGKTQYTHATRAIEAHEARMFAHASAREIETVMRVMQGIRRNRS